MARQTNTEWQAYYNAIFQTGVPGNIKASTMRGFALQIQENASRTIGTLRSTSIKSVPLTTTPTKLVLFDVDENLPANNTELTADAAADNLTSGISWIFDISCTLNLAGANNTVVFAQLYADTGSGFNPIAEVGNITLTGGNEPQQIVVPETAVEIPSGAVIELRAWLGSGSKTIDFSNAYLKAELIPWAK